VSDRWLWLSAVYDPSPARALATIQLNPIHVGDGKQWVYWEEWDATAGRWINPSYLQLAYRTVDQACRVLKIAGAPGVTYRLSRFDRTPQPPTTPRNS